MFARVWSCPSSCSLSLMENAENDNGGIMLMFTTTSYHQLVYTTSSSSSSSSTSSSLTSNLNLKEHQGRLFVLHFKVIPCLYNFSVRFWEDHRGLQGSLRYLKFFRSVQGNKSTCSIYEKRFYNLENKQSHRDQLYLHWFLATFNFQTIKHFPIVWWKYITQSWCYST